MARSFGRRGGDIATVRSLLAQGESVDKKNMGGFTPLMYAVENADMVRLLLEKGANPDYKTRMGWPRCTLL